MATKSTKAKKKTSAEIAAALEKASAIKVPPRSFGKHPGGRPQLYRPEMCAVAIECGRKGFSKVQIAAKLNVSRSMVDEWCVTHHEFSVAISQAMTFSQAWWEAESLKGIRRPASAFNAGLFGKVMAARFPHDYRERTQLYTEPGAPIEQKHSGTVALDASEAYKRMLNGDAA